MSFIRWFAGILLFLCMLSIVYKIGGIIINAILIICASVFFIDALLHGKKHV